MSKHTPGPWRGYKDRGVYVGDGFDHPIFETGCGCCTQTDLTEDNARLIAAAPDLLAALQGLLTYPLSTLQVVAAKYAIEKATGEQT